MQKSVQISRFQRTRKSKHLKEEYFLAVQNSKLKDTLHKYKLLKKLSAERLANYKEKQFQFSRGLQDIQLSLKQELEKWKQVKKLQAELDNVTIKLSQLQLNMSRDHERNNTLRRDIAALQKQIQHNLNQNKNLKVLYQKKKQSMTEQLLQTQEKLDQVLLQIQNAKSQQEKLMQQNAQSCQIQQLLNKIIDLRIIQQQMLKQNEQCLQDQADSLIQLQMQINDHKYSLHSLSSQLQNINRLVARQHQLLQEAQKQSQLYGKKGDFPIFVNISKKRSNILSTSLKSNNALLLELSRRRLSTEIQTGERSSRFRRIVLPKIDRSLTKR